jgi:hypothetical protein
MPGPKITQHAVRRLADDKRGAKTKATPAGRTIRPRLKITQPARRLSYHGSDAKTLPILTLYDSAWNIANPRVMQCSSAQQQYQADNQAPGMRNKGQQMITIATISIAAFTFFHLVAAGHQQKADSKAGIK